jgi:small conductance mechanosensitive channel
MIGDNDTEEAQAMTIESYSPAGEDLIALLGASVILAVVIFSAGLLAGLLLRRGPGRLVAGIMLKALKPFRPGDIISGCGVTGTVAAIHLFNTVLVMPDNATLLVPNVSLMEGTIVNHTAKGTRRVDIMFGIEYGGDVDAAMDIIEEVLSKDLRILAEPPPRVVVAEYCTCGVVLIAQPWVSASECSPVRSEITASVHKLFDAEGVTMHCLGTMPPTSAALEEERALRSLPECGWGHEWKLSYRCGSP